MTLNGGAPNYGSRLSALGFLLSASAVLGIPRLQVGVPRAEPFLLPPEPRAESPQPRALVYLLSPPGGCGSGAVSASSR